MGTRSSGGLPVDVSRLGGAAALALLSVGAGGCFAFVTKEEGKQLQQEIATVRERNTKLEEDSAALKKQNEAADAELKKLRVQVDEATKVVTRNSADLGQ